MVPSISERTVEMYTIAARLGQIAVNIKVTRLS